MKLIKSVAQAYREYAKGKTIIFCCSVKHAELLAEELGCESITGKTKNRDQLLKEFDVLTSCMVLTEGFNCPEIRTIIMARPTKSQVLYTQAVGRGTRKTETKYIITLIDCVGVSGHHSLCSAPTLLGIDIDAVERTEELEGNIFDLPDMIEQLSDIPESWIRNVELVKLFAKKNKYQTHDVNYFKMPDGSLHILGYKIDPINKLGNTNIYSSSGATKQNITGQAAFDIIHNALVKHHQEKKYIWNLTIVKAWGKYSASDKQMIQINRRFPDLKDLTKLQASNILNRIFKK